MELAQTLIPFLSPFRSVSSMIDLMCRASPNERPSYSGKLVKSPSAIESRSLPEPPREVLATRSAPETPEWSTTRTNILSAILIERLCIFDSNIGLSTREAQF